MAKVKHNPEAPVLISEYIDGMPSFAKAICTRLRTLILSADPGLTEDWKWGPNYYKNGMVCGFAAFQKHVNFVFFQGALLKDKKKLFASNEAALKTRTIRFTDVKQINEEIVLEYLFEAIDNNTKGLKVKIPKNRKVVIPSDVKKAFSKAAILKAFEKMSYSRKNIFMAWIEQAKREETRVKRIEHCIEKMKKGEAL
ncbi:MAG: DUF1801 domain-containing protein [Bacteroidia bacterium]